MDLNNLTPEQQQQVVQLLQQIQGQGPNANVAEQLTSAIQVLYYIVHIFPFSNEISRVSNKLLRRLLKTLRSWPCSNC